MEILYLLLIIAGLVAQNIAKKAHAVRAGSESVFTFSLGSVIFTLLFFILTSGFKLDFNMEVLPYSIGFAVSYGATNVAAFYAIKYGPLSMTSLITSYSLIIPTFYGILFLDEQTGPFLWFGLAALMISLFLVNYIPRKESAAFIDKSKRIDPRWFLFVALSFAGNGGCSTVQTVQQKVMNGEYKNEMMIVALLIVSLILLLTVILTEKKTAVHAVKGSWLLMVINGGFSGVVNLFVMLLAVLMNASVMFPIISAGSIIATAVISIIFYKEKLSKMQLTGFALGIAAVVLLNL